MRNNFVWFEPWLRKFSEVVSIRRILIFREQPARRLLAGGFGFEVGKVKRIAVDVFGKIDPLLFGFNFDGFVGVLKQMTNSLVTCVKVTNIFGGERSHEEINGGVGLLVNEEMKMIGHQTVGEKINFLSVVF